MSQSLKYKFRCAAFGQYNQSDDGHNVEDEMENSTQKLKNVDQLPEPKVEYGRDQNESPHDESCVPWLGYVGVIVEGCKGGNHVSHDCRRSSTIQYPGKDGYPSWN